MTGLGADLLSELNLSIFDYTDTSYQKKSKELDQD